MKILSMIKAVPRNLPTGLAAGSGLMPFIMDKGERAVMAAALGAIKGYYYDKAVFHGVGIEAIVGVAGYIGSALLGGNKHLERAGDVGMTTYMYAVGASWGSDKANRSVAHAAPKGVAGKKSPQQVVGVIPPRADGPFLTAEEMANNTGPR
ncbi:MAG: hypothetical protein V4550_18480 [Gemmatimonadota bacterium]